MLRALACLLVMALALVLVLPVLAADTTSATGKCPKCEAAVPLAPGQLLCPKCGLPLIRAAKNGTTLARGVCVKPHLLMDSQGTGLPALQLMVPVGWEFRGGVTWDLNNPALPAAVAFQVSRPQGVEAFEVFPNLCFYWNSSPLAAATTPIGSRTLAGEVRPSMSCQQMLRQVFLPRYRGNIGRPEITKEEPLPELPRAVNATAPQQGGAAEGARLRLVYDRAGTRLEEEVYGVTEYFRLPQTSMFGGPPPIIWLADYLFSVRAPAGRLDAAADLFKVVASSVRVNPSWLKAHDEIKTALCQNQIRHIQQIGAIGRQYAQTGAEIRQDNLQSWYGRQTINDGIVDKASRTIRGVDSYYDPHRETSVELPGGYGHAWANNLGEYIVTESPSFNPNEGSNLHWEPMTLQQ